MEGLTSVTTVFSSVMTTTSEGRAISVRVGALVCLIMLLICLVVLHLFPAKFERSVWLANNTFVNRNPRMEMASDLISTRLHPGMRRGEAIALLGEPRNVESYIAGDGAYYYILGARGIDPSFVHIEFDKHGLLKRASRFDR